MVTVQRSFKHVYHQNSILKNVVLNKSKLTNMMILFVCGFLSNLTESDLRKQLLSINVYSHRE